MLRIDPLLPLGILSIILIKVIGVLPTQIVILRSTPPARAVPEMERLAVHAVGRRDDLEEVPARDLDGGDLGGGEADEVGEDAADDRGVPDDKEVLLLALQLD